MPISMVQIGECFKITRITGRDEVRQHLAKLGFVAGEEVCVLTRIAGNVIVSMKGSRIALDESLANRIQV